MSFRSLALLVGLAYAVSLLYFQRWEVNIRYGGDSWGYYGYLPAAFIYGDLQNIDTSYMARFAYTGEAPAFPAPGGELPVAENGSRLIKYTCGVALLQLPFFLVAHGIALAWPGIPADGYSWPYAVLIHLANLVYFFWGLWLLYRVLKEETGSESAAWVTLALLSLGTHLYNFEVYRGPMAHGYLFSLYGMLMYATVRFYRQPEWRWAVFIGLSAGLITLIRPVEIICLAIPFLYGLTSREALRARGQLWAKNWRLLLAAAGVFVLCGLPQLFYWKYASGHWRFDGYPGEEFDFAHALIHAGLFSYRNGWLVYSPAMVLALLGMGWLARRRNWLWPILVFLPLHIYIAYSWWCWYYINGFGSRPMVEAAALLAVPMAWLAQWALARRWTAAPLALLVVGFIVLNLFQNWQHSKGILWTEAGNRAYYWSVFGKTSMSYDALVAFDSEEIQPDSNKLKPLGQFYANDFEQPDSTLDRIDTLARAGGSALRLTPERQFFELFAGKAGELSLQPGVYLRAAGWCRKDEKEFPWYMAPSLVISVDRAGKTILYRQVRIDSKLGNPEFSLWGGQPGVWGWVRLFVRLPDDLQPDDVVKAYFMTSAKTVYIDNVVADRWAPRYSSPSQDE